MNYPALFRKLEWWEERYIYEMPKYLEWNANEDHFIERFGKIVPTNNWYDYPKANIYHTYFHASRFLPVTEAEYLTYQQSLLKHE